MGKHWGWARGLLTVGLSVSLAASAAAPTVLAVPLGPCSRKRVDPCGCHHVYGVRHCHPNRKTAHCELPAKGRPLGALAAEQGRSL